MSQSEKIKVCLRFRPINSREKSEKVTKDITISYLNDGKSCKIKTNDESLSRLDKKKFTFDHVFPPDTSQKILYDKCCKGVVKQVIEGYNGTIFAYGQTGSGKTYTVLGSENDQNLNDEKLIGLIPRVANDIFENLEKISDETFIVTVEYIEIYQNKIYDLLGKIKRKLRIRRSPIETFIEGVNKKKVSSMKQIIEFLKYGSKHRFTRKTEMNERSSRSHSVFTIRIKRHNQFSETTKTGKFNLVDLAGSESVKKTDADGAALDEAKEINKSLSALGNVINALVEKKKHIPYRDSPLTKILEESLGGNSKTTIICCASPHAFNITETISTARFGQRAKTIKCKVKANILKSRKQLMRMIESLRCQLKNEQIKSKCFFQELKRLKGGDIDVNKLLNEFKNEIKNNNNDDNTIDNKNKNKNKNNNGGLDDDISFDISEISIELKDWKMKYEDKINELELQTDLCHDLKLKIQKEIENTRTISDKYNNKQLKMEKENEKLTLENFDLNKKLNNSSNLSSLELIKLEKEKNFLIEDLNEYKKLYKDNEEKQITLEAKVSLYEDLGYGSKIQEILEEYKKEILELQIKIIKITDDYKILIDEKEKKIKSLNDLNNKKSNQKFKLAFDNKKLKKQLKEFKKANKKLEKKNQKTIEKMSKEKKKFLKQIEKQSQSLIEKNKKYYEEIMKKIKDDNSKKVEELLKQIESIKSSPPVTSNGDGGMEKNNEEEIQMSIKKIQMEYVQKMKMFSEKIDSLIIKEQDQKKENLEIYSQLNKKNQQILILKNDKKGLKSQIKELNEKNKLESEQNKQNQEEYNQLEASFDKFKTDKEDETKKYKEIKTKFDQNEKKCNILNEEIVQLKQLVTSKDEKIAKLHNEVIKKEATQTQMVGSQFKKKVGTRLGLINELRIIRTQYKSLQNNSSKYRKESDQQRKQIRSNVVEISQLRDEKTKLKSAYEILEKRLKDTMINHQNKIDDKNKKIQELNLVIEDLEERIREIEQYDKINRKYQNEFENYDDDQIQDSKSPNGETIEDENINLRSPMTPTKQQQQPYITAKDDNFNFVENPQPTSFSISRKKSRVSISDYIKSGRALQIQQMKHDLKIIKKFRSPTKTPEQKNKNKLFFKRLKKNDEKPIPLNVEEKKNAVVEKNIDIANISGSGSSLTPRPQMKKVPPRLIDMKKRMQRSLSFNVKGSKTLDRKKFHQPKKLENSPWDRIILKKTDHGLW